MGNIEEEANYVRRGNCRVLVPFSLTKLDMLPNNGQLNKSSEISTDTEESGNSDSHPVVLNEIVHDRELMH